jgi:hypothetical protein
MSDLPSHHRPTSRANGGFTASAQATAESPAANIPIDVSKPIFTGVNVSINLGCDSGESSLPNDEGLRGMPQAGSAAE